MSKVNGISAETKCNVEVIPKENIYHTSVNIHMAASIDGEATGEAGFSYPEGFSIDNCCVLTTEIYKTIQKVYGSNVRNVCVYLNTDDVRVNVTGGTSGKDIKVRVLLYKFK